MKKLVSLGLLSHLPANKPRLVRANGQRLACVRRGTRVDVLDDRCPHEGKPLSMGHVREGVLTCPWHNWKFDLESGRCLFGGEAVRRYPAETHDGEVFVDLELDEDFAARRLGEDLVRAVEEGSIDGALREGLRLAKLAPLAPWRALVAMACRRTAYGAGDALVAIAAARALPVGDAEALAIAIAAVADEVRGRAPRALPEPIPGTLADRDAFLEDLLEERRTPAIARALGCDDDFLALTDAWLVPFASLKVWDGGHLLGRIRAAETIAAWLGDAELRAGLVTACGWAVAESDLPAWRATRTALREAARVAPGEGPVDALDLGSERAATASVLEALRAGAAPVALLEALGRAALHGLAGYDVAHSRSSGAITAWDAAAGIAFADAALVRPAPPRLAASHAILLAGLVGRLARLGGAPARAAVDVREAVLAPRCGWATRGRPAIVAAACLRLGARIGAEDVAAAAIARALVDDVGGGLARLAATAERIVDHGAIDEEEPQ